MKNEDEFLRNILNSDLNIPERYDNMIMQTLNSLPNKKRYININKKIKLIVAYTCCIVFLTTGIVHAKKITNVIQNFFNNNSGIDKAIENGYIQYEDIQTTNSNETNIKIENFLMDDFNLSFTFSVNMKNELWLDKDEELGLYNMIISDENNNILYGESKESFERYCTENNLDYKYGEYKDGYIMTESNWYNDDENKIIYNLYGNKFPRCKKLYISISNIYIIDSKSRNINRNIKGHWTIELDVPQKFYNRNCIVYMVTKCSNDKLNITDFSVYDTCTKFECNIKLKPLCLQKDSTEIKKSKMIELLEWEKRYKTKESYIEDEYGNIYSLSKSSSSDAIRKCSIDGEFYCCESFVFTKYDETSKLRLHFYLNEPQINEEIVIELERKYEM